MDTCDFVKLGSTNLPGVVGIQPTHEVIADRVRTLSGAMRQDYVTTKMSWRVTLNVTGAERQAVIALVKSEPGSRPVTIDEHGTTVTAYVTIARDQRTAKRERAAPHNWDFLGGTLELLIEEA